MEDELKVGGLFKLIHIGFEVNCNKHLNKYNLTLAQMDMLMYLNCHSDVEVIQRDLELAFKLKNPTVTGILNRLEEKGLILRKKNKDDKRYRIIEMTEKGREIVKTVKSEFEEIESKYILKDFDDDEKKELVKLLRRVIKNLND